MHLSERVRGCSSLGAGTAALVSCIMQSQHGVASECFGFATPSCMDAAAAARMDHVTSVILRDDIVPRASVYNAYQLVCSYRELPWEEIAEGDSFRECFSNLS